MSSSKFTVTTVDASSSCRPMYGQGTPLLCTQTKIQSKHEWRPIASEARQWLDFPLHTSLSVVRVRRLKFVQTRYKSHMCTTRGSQKRIFSDMSRIRRQLSSEPNNIIGCVSTSLGAGCTSNSTDSIRNSSDRMESTCFKQGEALGRLHF